jgi:hypothetical protein
MDDFDRAVDAARSLRVPEEDGRRTVDAVLRRAAMRVPRQSRWQWIAVASWGTSVALVAYLWLAATVIPVAPAPTLANAPVSATPPVEEPLTQLGARVFAHPQDAARYAVLEATSSVTRVRVSKGTVAFRLLHGPKPHRLVVTAGDWSVEAVGTVFFVGLRAGAPFVAVQEGRVRVQRGKGETAVDMGMTLLGNGDVVAAPFQEDESLAALSDADVEPLEQAEPRPAAPKSVVETPKSLWLDSRRLRDEGHLAQSASVLERLAGADDSTWSPLALLELGRLRAESLEQPEAAVGALDDFLRRFPEHALTAESKALRCRALRKLGRSPPECNDGGGR